MIKSQCSSSEIVAKWVKRQATHLKGAAFPIILLTKGFYAACTQNVCIMSRSSEQKARKLAQCVKCMLSKHELLS